MKKKVLVPLIAIQVIALSFILIPREQKVEDSKEHIATTNERADVGSVEPVKTDLPTGTLPTKNEGSKPVASDKEPETTETQIKDDNPYIKPGNLAHVYDKRKAAGKLVGNWGPADLWYKYARDAGCVIDKNHAYGAAFTLGNGSFYFVESVGETAFTASTYIGGYVTQEFPLIQAQTLRFIH